MKQQLLAEIWNLLGPMGIPLQAGNGADITVTAEFLDARWSTGSKRIGYEASILADEADKTLWMYEKTTEVGQGLSFSGFSAESSFQSGSTLMRKVKSIQYGPDGKAYEYNLDLGAVSKTAKEAARRYGWKFKTALNRKKAMYAAP